MYICLLGLLPAAWSLLGYDSTAHMIEETKEADANAGWSMPYAVGISAVSGLPYIIALTLCVQVILFPPVPPTLHSFLPFLLLPSFIHTFESIRAFIRSIIHSIICSFVDSFIASSIHACIQSFIALILFAHTVSPCPGLPPPCAHTHSSQRSTFGVHVVLCTLRWAVCKTIP